MKKVRRLVASLLAVLLIALIPTSVFAMGYKGYIPTAGQEYYLDNGQWKLQGTFKYTYDSKGRIKKYVSTSTSGYVYTATYKWKGDYIVKVSASSSDGYAHNSSKTFKKNRIQKQKAVTVFDGKSTTYTDTYKWKGKKATVTEKDSDGKVSIYTIKVNGKNKSVYYSSGDWTEKTSYYANGNYKSTSYGTNGAEKTSYNKNGYPVKHIGIISHYNSDHVLIKTENYTRSFSYTMDKKKKCPKEKLETESHPDGTTYQSKTVYTSFKKVSGARNCDASGNGVPFG